MNDKDANTLFKIFCDALSDSANKGDTIAMVFDLVTERRGRVQVEVTVKPYIEEHKGPRLVQ